jgi:hypothetical protein
VEEGCGQGRHLLVDVADDHCFIRDGRKKRYVALVEYDGPLLTAERRVLNLFARWDVRGLDSEVT